MSEQPLPEVSRHRLTAAIVTDAANVLTTCGLILAASAVGFAQHGMLEYAGIAAMWSLLIDHFDGVVARKLAHRPIGAAELGKQLDSFADLISAAWFPASMLIYISDSSPLATAAGLLLCCTAAVRLSWFGVIGLDPMGRFRGLPVTYSVPAFSLLIGARPLLSLSAFSDLGVLTAVSLSILFLSPFRIRALSGRGYLYVSFFVVLMSIYLLMLVGGQL